MPEIVFRGRRWSLHEGETIVLNTGRVCLTDSRILSYDPGEDFLRSEIRATYIKSVDSLVVGTSRLWGDLVAGILAIGIGLMLALLVPTAGLGTWLPWGLGSLCLVLGAALLWRFRSRRNWDLTVHAAGTTHVLDKRVASAVPDFDQVVNRFAALKSALSK